MPVPNARRSAMFHRESTRLRSNVADQVQRDLLPAGRMLSVFLVGCELLAEIAVLAWSRGQACNRPLRLWVCVLMMLQGGTVMLNCMNIWNARDAFGTHRQGLGSTEMEMYGGEEVSTEGVSTEVVDRYVRIVNAWYLMWFVLGSYWVTTGDDCAKSAPHLYRLVVALAIIYYALLLLPLACFCLIVCCLPLFILVYRIMLPYAERERRRARAADPQQVQSLNSIKFSPAAFVGQTGNESLEDASCVICLCEYEAEEEVRFLPCKHHFHKECVDVWLKLDKACCLCKQDIDAQTEPLSSHV